MKLISLLLFPFWVFAQNTSQITALEKYSYPILVKEIGKEGFTPSTGFFYRRGPKIFLVSNYHVFTGMDPYTLSQARNIEIIKVGVGTKSPNDTIPINFNPRMFLQKGIEHFAFYDRIDLYAIEVIVNKNDFIFNCINDQIDTTYFDKQGLEYLAYGYPDTYAQFGASEQLYKGKFDDDWSLQKAILIKEHPNQIKEVNASVAKARKSHYCIKPESSGGTSGSPVFAKYIDKNKKIIYRFAGVIGAGQNNHTLIIKPGPVLKYLENL